MKEDFLHYLWKFKKFELSNLQTVQGQNVIIWNSGHHSDLAGPDFFNAQISIDQQKWAGNVEIHLKSSDWYIHHHETDQNYDSVILHVVWEHDTEVYRKNNTEIPVLELKKYVSKETLTNYQSLMIPKTWIFCEKQMQSIDTFVFTNWQQRLFFERLERKSKPILELAQQSNNDWESLLFNLISKNFGLNTNGEIFQKMTQAFPFSIVRKESFDVENLEALFFGTLGLLDQNYEDQYYSHLKSRFLHITHKYQLAKPSIEPVQFFRHRPDNFPTIRLSQLAQLYNKQQNLFSKVIAVNSIPEIYTIFQSAVSEYWQTHYQFDKQSPKKSKSLSKSFIDLLIVNTLIPIRFAYYKSQGKEISEELIQIMNQIAPEKNNIIEKFQSIGIQTHNAFDSQSLLQLKNEYCNKNRCLSCAIGIELMKTN